MEPEWGAKSQGDVARFFGVGLQTVSQSWVAAGCPLVKTGSLYDLQAITQWKLAHERKRRPKSEDELLLDNADQDWKDRWVRGKALLTEEQLAQVRGDLVEIGEITPRLRMMAEVIRDGIRRLEAEYGPDAADVIRTPLERLQEEVKALSDSDAD
jgi:phage terminase Nu1 subunit (DNA packaging protein)